MDRDAVELGSRLIRLGDLRRLFIDRTQELQEKMT
jgi:hypothetical protein